MGLLCAILVASIHVRWPHDIPLSPGWFVWQGLSEGFARLAVPYFFVVSGFFLARHFDEKGWWKREIGKRWRSLGVPYVVWSLIALIAIIVLSLILATTSQGPDGQPMPGRQFRDWLAAFRLNRWGIVFGLDLLALPLLVPLWYIRCLFILVVSSPVLLRCMAGFKRSWLVVSFLSLLLSGYLPAGPWEALLVRAFRGLFYFSVGIALQTTRIPALPRGLAVFSGIVGLALMGTKIAAAARGWSLEYGVHCLSLPFLLCFLWSIVPSAKWPDWLTSCSFPFFVMHWLAIRFIEPPVLHFGMVGVCVGIAEWAGSIVLACIATLCIRRQAPKMARVLFGGR